MSSAIGCSTPRASTASRRPEAASTAPSESFPGHGRTVVNLGCHLPMSGPVATRDNVLALARRMEALGYDSLWALLTSSINMIAPLDPAATDERSESAATPDLPAASVRGVHRYLPGAGGSRQAAAQRLKELRHGQAEFQVRELLPGLSRMSRTGRSSRSAGWARCRSPHKRLSPRGVLPGAHSALWKITPRLYRSPDSKRLTPCRSVVR